MTRSHVTLICVNWDFSENQRPVGTKSGSARGRRRTENRPKMSHVRLEEDWILRKRWKVLKKLAAGGFGAVYEVSDKTLKKKVALKIESAKQANPVLKLETAILAKLRGKTQHVCGVVGTGAEEEPKFNFVAMDLVGRSLSDLHKLAPDRKLQESTVIRLGLQCLKGIEELHKIGFVHRDVKPGNFAIGRGSTRRIVYLLDFGLARYFLVDGDLRPPRDSCGFRGTVRYASSNAHNGLELGRHDDIWSLYCVLIEFQRGKLPWHDLADEKDVAIMKRKLSADEVIGEMESEFKDMHERLKGTRYAHKPDYEWFVQKFRAIQKRKKLAPRGVFEWEEKEE